MGAQGLCLVMVRMQRCECLCSAGEALDAAEQRWCDMENNGCG